MAEWFEEWFDSEYYHILYKDRNHKEAEEFIKNLIDYLKLDKSASVLDVACGSGRHALQFSLAGYDTVGIDLSANSIESANQFASENLKFEVADMRDFQLAKSFELVTNLFTSFGYFSDLDDNLKALKRIFHHLEANGFFILDFMNTERVIKNLVAESEKTVSGINFTMTRAHQSGKIIKTIKFSDKEKVERIYREQVQSIFYDDFVSLFNAVDFEVKACFGDYGLRKSYSVDSDRMIFVLKKAKS